MWWLIRWLKRKQRKTYNTTFYTSIFHHLCWKKKRVLWRIKVACDGMKAASDQRLLFAGALILKAPQELQRQFVGEKHGGAHGEPSDGVDWRSAEENLHASRQGLSHYWFCRMNPASCRLTRALNLSRLWPLTFEQQLTGRLWLTVTAVRPGWYNFRSVWVFLPDI